jgi:hypothetical protein
VWGPPTVLYDTGHNTGLKFSNSIWSEIPWVLVWNNQIDSIHSIWLHDFVWTNGYQKMDFHQSESFQPAYFTIMMLVDGVYDLGFLSFTRIAEDTNDIFTTEYEFLNPWLNQYVNLSNTTGNDCNSNMYMGLVHGFCLHDIVNIWEAEVGGKRQLWASINEYCLTGGVEENELSEAAYSIYPNPTRGILNIAASSMQTADNKIRIYNSSGQIVYIENLMPGPGIQQINIKRLPQGTYFISIEQVDKKYSQRIILSK